MNRMTNRMTDREGRAELRRLAYLDAMGVPAYVSRGPLPGAASTRRLAVRITHPGLPGGQLGGDVSTDEIAAILARNKSPTRGTRTESAPQPADAPQRAGRRADAPQRAGRRADAPQRAERPAGQAQDVPVFSVAATLVGGWYWLEEIPPGRGGGEDYIHLLQSICIALGLPTESPRHELFNWPLRTGGYLDRDVAAARETFKGFVDGRMDKLKPAQVVALGEWDSRWHEPGLLPANVATVSIGARQMLRQPQLKRQAWEELKAIAPPASAPNDASSNTSNKGTK